MNLDITIYIAQTALFKNVIIVISYMQVEYCRLPGLAVALTLDNAQESSSQEGISDLVAFTSGLLLGNDITVRNWFAQFVRTGQKVREDYDCLEVT